MSAPTLRAPTREDVEAVREWRNDDAVRAGLRTPLMLTEEMQQGFYNEVICDRRSPHRYWSFRSADRKKAGNVEGRIPLGSLVAFGGLTDISWENGHAEISLIVDPKAAGKGVGSEAVKLILREAFERMRLLTVFGEVYHCNPAKGFWEKLDGYGGAVDIPNRKWWDGGLYASTLFWFTAP